MSGDLEKFFLQHELQQVDLLGHSMGGKTAMVFALTKVKSTFYSLNFKPIKWYGMKYDFQLFNKKYLC